MHAAGPKTELSHPIAQIVSQNDDIGQGLIGTAKANAGGAKGDENSADYFHAGVSFLF